MRKCSGGPQIGTHYWLNPEDYWIFIADNEEKIEGKEMQKDLSLTFAKEDKSLLLILISFNM